MPHLSPELRGTLERAVIRAREEAEKAAEVALKTLAVDKNEAFATHSERQRRLRNALRAKGRQLGGGSLSAGLRLLVEEVAYEQWHRMLFARFLLENDLLIHPSGAAVSLEDCADLAKEAGESDPWELAARYASGMLPGIFAKDDPSVSVVLAPEGRAVLENIVAGLPAPIFTSDDGLGWVYQFWQSKKRKEVSVSGRKIGGADLGPATQLFTDHYQVRFLLDNSLGAWWVALHPDSPLVKQFTYLRFGDDGSPAAGTFQGWPKRAAQVTVLDPCCGSGHFLLATLQMLAPMRMEEEGLDAAEAVEAVVQDNLFGLEIDARCVQIAAFALALAAWKTGGYRRLPLPHIACSGIPAGGQIDEWTRLAGDDVNLKFSLEALYELFRSAPDLGSLINPVDIPVRHRMFAPDAAKVEAILERVLDQKGSQDPVAAVFGEGAIGISRAAQLLARQYTLVATNVPYLTRNKQSGTIKGFCESRYGDAKADLATVFLLRCREFCTPGGSYATVTPQNWLFLSSYKRLRSRLLMEQQWDHVSRVGSGATATASWEVPRTLSILTDATPTADHQVSGIDASLPSTTEERARALHEGPIKTASQKAQLRNPDARLSLDPESTGALLREYAESLQGISPADFPRFGRYFWEVTVGAGWELWQGTPDMTRPYGGRSRVLWWNTALLEAFESGRAYMRGQNAWHRRGVAVGQMRLLPCTLYTGEKFDTNVAVIVPHREEHLGAIWAYCLSPEFNTAVRSIDSKLSITNATLVKVPFDLDRWMTAAHEMGPLPEPHSNDPTQWLFKGDPVGSTVPLQVAVARLLGYHWPLQHRDQLTTLADEDGIVALSSVAREEPAAERLRGLLALAYGDSWSPRAQERLLNEFGFAGKGFDAWLRDGFFEQHCKLFQQRPFLWHIWDGRRDGFSALLNYQSLDSARLDKLIYTYLGEWIRTQRAARDDATIGAEGRLVAALDLQKKLEAIRDGEPPYDIYVRWKPLEEQPIGWNPDLSDGVRINIRPFVEAGILRTRVNVNWNKDRGLNADGSERVNDRHLTVAEKQAARRVAKP